MANEVDYSPCQYVGNGATQDFSFNWKVINIDELIVQLENIETGELTTLNRGSDYSAAINTIGGNVTLTGAPSADYYINISRQTSNYQSKGYSTSTGFQGSEIEKSFDTVSCCLQDMDYNIETFKTEFTDDITEQVQSFEDDINSKLTQVNDAVNQLNRLDEVLAECESYAANAEDAVSAAEEQAITAQNYAVTSEEQAAIATDKAAEIQSMYEEAVQTFANDLSNAIETINSQYNTCTSNLEAQYKQYLEILALNKSKALTYKQPRFIYADKDILTMYAGTVIQLTNDELFTAENDLIFKVSDILDTDTIKNGEDYYFYINEDKNLICTSTESSEGGLTLIGGAHTLCVGVTEDNAPALCDDSFWDTHPAIGYDAGYFIPNSTWTPVFKSTAKTGNKGMAYIEYPGIQPFWVDIYLQSGTGEATASSYAGTVINNRQCILHEWDMKQVGKKLPCDYQFITFAEGSNNKTNISGGAVPSDKLTGGYYDTAGKRMISGYFIECCCGYLWQWGDEISPHGGSSWSAYGQTTRGGSYGMPYVLRFGGEYDNSTNCGSWSRSSSNTRSSASASTGARGVSFHYELAV